MVMFKAHTKAAGMIAAAALLAALCTAFAHTPALASEVESPFTKVESFAEDIRDYVGSVAEEAAERAEAADRARALKKKRVSVVDEALGQLGVPYAYGGTTPSGFDCSGFTRWVFSHALGRELPRTAAEQSALGRGVSLDKLASGDLLFWGSGEGVYHVGIYVSDGKLVHASPSNGGIVQTTLEYYTPDFAKRIIG